MTRAPLAGAELYDWIALRRVSDGGIARMGDRWFDGGRRVPGYLTGVLTALYDDGLVTLAELDGCGMQRASLIAPGSGAISSSASNGRHHSNCPPPNPSP